MGASKAALILMKNSHFDRTLRYANLGSAASYHDGYLMHHKFAIIDDRVLITGSFNWTMQAIIGNKENLIITSDPRLVQPFVREFKKIWAQLDEPAVPSEEGWLS